MPRADEFFDDVVDAASVVDAAPAVPLLNVVIREVQLLVPVVWANFAVGEATSGTRLMKVPILVILDVIPTPLWHGCAVVSAD
jgi:hypothetical protein